MGWMEVLALLKRIAPLLGRLAPMLETFLATRAGGRADVEALDRLSADIRSHLVTAGEQHSTLADALGSQTTLLESLARQMDRAQQRDIAAEAQVQSLAGSIAALRQLVVVLTTGLFLLLCACVGLLLWLILHKPA